MSFTVVRRFLQKSCYSYVTASTFIITNFMLLNSLNSSTICDDVISGNSNKIDVKVTSTGIGNKPKITKSKKNIPDCETPACHSTIQSLNKSMLGIKKSYPTDSKENKKSDGLQLQLQGCPIDINVLGASTWNLIHTLAEHISEEPDIDEQTQIITFMQTLSALYPCHICRVSYCIMY